MINKLDFNANNLTSNAGIFLLLEDAKYDMNVGHLLLKSFWANEAVFQMMMLSYNLV